MKTSLEVQRNWVEFLTPLFDGMTFPVGRAANAVHRFLNNCIIKTPRGASALQGLLPKYNVSLEEQARWYADVNLQNYKDALGKGPMSEEDAQWWEKILEERSFERSLENFQRNHKVSKEAVRKALSTLEEDVAAHWERQFNSGLDLETKIDFADKETMLDGHE